MIKNLLRQLHLEQVTPATLANPSHCAVDGNLIRINDKQESFKLQQTVNTLTNHR